MRRLRLAGSFRRQVDDTEARHQGQNGYCTRISNAFFTSFAWIT